MAFFRTSSSFSKKRRLGDLLIDEGVITKEQLIEALDRQNITKEKLGEALVNMKLTNEEGIVTALHRQLGYEMVVLSSIKISNDIISLVPDSTVLKKYNVIPYAFDDQNSRGLKLAMADPLDIIAMDDIGIIANMDIVPAISTMYDILAAIDRYYGSKEAQAVAEQYTKEREKQYQDTTDEETGRSEVESSPIVILVKTLIEQAVRQRTSDIHIEPMEKRIRVRYRIDGMLTEVGSYPYNLLPAIVTRIKIIGGMDISEKRRPQDGRITQIVDKQEYDIRASILPTVFGEKIVMRLTSKTTLTRDKKHLGFSDEELEKFDNILKNPNGIILVTGPTGSGKSTTLYTALSELNRPDLNIITIEDPVEANIDGISQVQVNIKAGMTFAAALRSMLRQDPDIIMIGEIRDQETAEIAITASITGHLVVSTLHTNNACSSITRLIDMGIEPYLLADAASGVIAQRLVRKLCTCKRKHELTELETTLLEINDQAEYDIYEPFGCTSCNDSGYKGRLGIYEIMPVTKNLKLIIAKGANTDMILEQALKDGMSTLKMSAARLVREGVTSLEELKRIAYSNEDGV